MLKRSIFPIIIALIGINFIVLWFKQANRMVHYHELWERPVINQSAMVINGHVIGDRNVQKLILVNSKTGENQKTISLAQQRTQVYEKGNFYTLDGNNILYKYNLENLSIEWKLDLSDFIRGSVQIDLSSDLLLITTGFSQQEAFIINNKTGSPIQQIKKFEQLYLDDSYTNYTSWKELLYLNGKLYIFPKLNLLFSSADKKLYQSADYSFINSKNQQLDYIKTVFPQHLYHYYGEKKDSETFPPVIKYSTFSPFRNPNWLIFQRKTYANNSFSIYFINQQNVQQFRSIKDVYPPFCLHEQYFITRRINNKFKHQLSIVELGTWREKKLFLNNASTLEEIHTDHKTVYLLLNTDGKRSVQALPLDFEQRILD